ncbi:MAG: hypothetical protein IKC43_01115 [Clostridia bacterium]|nr:hypothetical protein [Clostridia bacterium]
MYTKRPIQPLGEPLRLPEHYSGVAFSRKEPSAPPPTLEAASADASLEPMEEPKEVPCQKEEKDDSPPKKQGSILGIGGREDILLLILALLLLDDEGGDDMLAYILLGLLFLG